MLDNVLGNLEKMTEAQQAELLNTQFPEELVKQAEAEVDAMTLVEACKSLGSMRAERELAEAEGLDKVASAEDLAAHEAAMVEVGEDIDTLIGNLGLANAEDPIAMHKEAQAAAGFIFQGYVEALEKVAAGKGHEMVSKMIHKAKGAMHHAGAHVKAHKGKYALGLATAGVAGAGAHHAMKKKASEVTVEELMSAFDARDNFAEGIVELEQNFDKMANAAVEMGKKMHGKLKEYGGKAVELAKKHKGHAAAGGAGLVGGYLAAKAQK